MIFLDYNQKVVYSDDKGSVELGDIKPVNGIWSFVAGKGVIGIALEPQDLLLIGKIVRTVRDSQAK